jgi:hypothetical protein
MISIVAGSGQLQLYRDILANVRYDSRYHSIKSLVQPDDPTVRAVARVLVQADDFISATQEFVDSFTTYRTEVGDYWAKPHETLDARAGDCDDKAILLTSILRNYIPPDQVYCAYGIWLLDGEESGHMYVVSAGENGDDRIIEATAGPDRRTRGKYILYGMFNDQHAFSTDIGLREFSLKKVEIEKPAPITRYAQVLDDPLEDSALILESLEGILAQTPKPSKVWNGSLLGRSLMNEN